MFSNSQGVYISYLTRAQKKAAVARGWRMSFSCIAIEGVTFSILDLVPYRKRFDLYVVSRQGSQVLLLHSRYKPQFAGEEYSIEGAPGTAHTYEMVAAAGSATVRVSVDGKKLASSYAGQPDYQEDKNVVFGVAQYKSEKAEGIIRSVRFEILG
jgi:hypothetical protein